MPVPNHPCRSRLAPPRPARSRAAPLLAALLLAGAASFAAGGAALGQTPPDTPSLAQPSLPQPSPSQPAPAPEPEAPPAGAAPLVPQVAAPEPPQAAPVAAEEAAPVLPDSDAGQPPAPAEAPAQAQAAPRSATPAPAGQGTAAPEGMAVDPAGIDRATLPHDLSPIGMFRAADWVVKAVMIGLAFASLVTWTIFLAKVLEFAAASRTLRRGLRVVTRAETLPEAAGALAGRRDPVALMAQGALQEAERSEPTLDHGGAPGVKERVASYLGRVEAAGVRRLNRGTGLLATIGSTAPFVGLFGTVWGIMNSFIGISEAQTTNLAVVAPGIAEALLATAIGLVAAIPAVVIYNLFARTLGLYRAGLGDAAAAVERLVSRDLDFRDLPPAGQRRRV